MQRRDMMKGMAGILAAGRAPALIAAAADTPAMPYGAMSGDILADRAMLLGFADRPARILVEWATNPGFRGAVRRTGSLATPDTGGSARLDLDGLPPATEIFARVAMADPDNGRNRSDWVPLSFTTPGGARPVRFVFSGDECGQGYGINLEFGGFRTYEAMRQKRPHFFIHQGDQIYADGPLKEERPLPDGRIWRNIVTPAKLKNAETLDEFRGNFAYNLLDTNKRHFLSEVPILTQWDDHEVRNNWWPDKELKTPPDMRQLIAFGRQATLEYNPIRLTAGARGIQRRFSWGPHLDVFVLDARTYRQTNQWAGGPDERPAPMFGESQIRWLKAELAASRATWKLIASNISPSLIVRDGNRDVPPGGMEGLPNGRPGAPGGRETELADLLSFLKARGIRNCVWIAADVHHAAALRCTPERAAFTDFDPYWEFTGGPICAGTGTIATSSPDPTFGPEVMYACVPAALADPSPLSGNQFFGFGEVDPKTRGLRMALCDIDGKERYAVDLQPA